LKPNQHRLIACCRRTQGVMVRKEHAPHVRTLGDLARNGLRFVNRQPGSGTRLLVDHLLHEQSLSPERLQGYADHIENTHVAVALCVASGVADAGIGIEAAALQFGLHFTPLLEENYFLACLEPSLAEPSVQRLREVLAGPRWREILEGLPGYGAADAPGGLLAPDEALLWWGREKVPPSPAAPPARAAGVPSPRR